MNEQIKLLKHQASLWCDENIPEQFSEETNGYGSAWEDKFAEMIVRECLNTMENCEGDLDFAIWKTKKDFGIEE